MGNRESSTKYDIEVDATGLYCPLPILKLEKAFRDREPGTLALLRATDPAAVEDVEVLCRARRHELVRWTREGAVFSFLVKKGSEGSILDSRFPVPGPV
jgi:tRNA 2-thiouridine synthesizing protein A